jgi:NAD(P)-dependent dehydrogenase (short-subunit alcohol dehydrogenase family)
MSLPVLAFFRSQLHTKLPISTTSFAGKTVIITGSNTGMGLEAARHIVHLGATKVILAVRSTSRGDAAAASIAQSTGLSGITEVWELDLARYSSVRAFAARAAAQLDRLDVVVENAGVYTETFRLAEDGDELSIAVNVVGTMLLSLLLLPKLRETAERFDTDVVLTFTGSFVHWMTKFPERKEENIFLGLAREKGARMIDR